MSNAKFNNHRKNTKRKVKANAKAYCNMVRRLNCVVCDEETSFRYNPNLGTGECNKCGSSIKNLDTFHYKKK